MHSPDHSTKGTPSALGPPSGQWPLTAGENRGSGSLSSPLRGTFHLSLTVLVHYRSLKVLSLGGCPPSFPQTHRGSWYSGCQSDHRDGLATGLSPSLARRSSL